MFRRMIIVIDWWLHDVAEDEGQVTRHTEILQKLRELREILVDKAARLEQ